MTKIIKNYYLFILLIICEIFTPMIIKLIAPGFNENPEKFLLSVDLARLTFPFVVFDAEADQ